MDPEIKQRNALFKKMKKEHYTVLIPDMCPIHFALIAKEIDGMKSQEFGV